jgi:NTE family protein
VEHLLTSQIRPNDKKVAVVIGSGSVKCAAALGLQRVLERQGIEIDLIVGCSGGSLYATTMALGYDAATAVDMTRRLWTKETTRPTNRRALLRAVLPRVFGFDERFSLHSDVRIMANLREAFGQQTFADTRIPLHIAATDLRSGHQVDLHQGSIVDAIRASIALPFVFEPWAVDGRLLIDGVLSDPLPVGLAIRGGANVILAMGFESPYQERITSPVRYAYQISSIMANNLLRSNYSFHGLAHHSEIIPIVPEFQQPIGMFDIDKIPYIIEEGERAAELQLPYLRRLMQAAASAQHTVSQSEQSND